MHSHRQLVLTSEKHLPNPTCWECPSNSQRLCASFGFRFSVNRRHFKHSRLYIWCLVTYRSWMPLSHFSIFRNYGPPAQWCQHTFSPSNQSYSLAVSLHPLRSNLERIKFFCTDVVEFPFPIETDCRRAGSCPLGYLHRSLNRHRHRKS